MGLEIDSLLTSQSSNEVPETIQQEKSNAEIGNFENHRKRKRHFYNAIRLQIEFYFGDANLSKDRYLNKMITEDPFVPLKVFLDFNKIKALTTSLEDIAKSLTNSELLELDELQQKVRRKLPVPLDRNVDDRTLYVESLPSTADHEWVRKMFERFGSVAYVSLPKYSKSKKIKEFAFVEFDEKASMDKAIEAFKEMNGLLNTGKINPAELTSIKTFEKKETESKPNNNATKRAQSCDNDNNIEEPAKKRLKTIESELQSPTENPETTAVEEIAEKKESEVVESEMTPKKKSRKKKKNAKSAEQRKDEIERNADASYYELKVLSKRDWKSLRNKYLNLQREKMSELKRKAWKERQAQQDLKDNAIEVPDAVTSPPNKKAKQSESKLQKMNMNFYGAGGGEDESQSKVAIKEVKQNSALERAPLFSYEPGLIVEVSFLEPCVNVKEFKAEMKHREVVKYVDVKEGGMVSYLRLESATVVEDFIRQLNCAEYKCKQLHGDAELEYWKKIEKDREEKFNKKVKLPQKRGREKIKKLVVKHLRFGDEDEEE